MAEAWRRDLEAEVGLVGGGATGGRSGGGAYDRSEANQGRSPRGRRGHRGAESLAEGLGAGLKVGGVAWCQFPLVFSRSLLLGPRGPNNGRLLWCGSQARMRCLVLGEAVSTSLWLALPQAS